MISEKDQEAEKNQQVEQDRASRFLSFAQVKVSLVGPMEKIFIARDESFIVTLQELETKRRHMIEFT